MVEGPPEVARAQQVIHLLHRERIAAWLLGGIAIYLTCPSARPPSPLSRQYSDVDLVVAEPRTKALANALVTLHAKPAERFNALHGHSRLLFTFEDGMHLDVFVGRFSMCHALDLAGRLQPGTKTISPADLMLTKLQVAQLNKRDVLDLCALLLDIRLTNSEAGINVDYVTTLLSADWGWWRTVTENLEQLKGLAGQVGLPGAEQGTIRDAVTTLQQAVEAAPRSRKWRIRAAIGTRLPWRQEPEEVG